MKRILFGLFFLLVCNTSLHAQTPFYQGKTITLITGLPREASMMLMRASSPSIGASTFPEIQTSSCKICPGPAL